VAFGFADGTIRLAHFGFRSSFPRTGSLPESAKLPTQDEVVAHEKGLLTRTGEGKLRLQRFAFSLGEPMQTSGHGAIRRLAHGVRDQQTVFCALFDDRRLTFIEESQQTSFMTGEVTTELEEHPLPYDAPPEAGLPQIEVTGLGDNVYLVWEDGALFRLDVRDPEAAGISERLDLTPEPGDRLTAIGFLIGKTTLLAGDSAGRVSAWFRTKPANADTIDRTILSRGHVYDTGKSPVTSLSASPRTRLLAAGTADGRVSVWQATTENRLADVVAEVDVPVQALSLAPKDNAVIASVGSRLVRWSLDVRHPETSLATLFGPVWYEGYEKPEHVWQSEGGSDEFEPKLGFMPLVFGTIKATFYSMLFGTPIALLAAIYTSEFLDRRLRVPIKSLIEMMASLPSVVLGFLAALVIAPFAQTIVPATLAFFVTLPLALLCGAYLWQLLPQGIAL
jgi:phosphate transport system permease protein